MVPAGSMPPDLRPFLRMPCGRNLSTLCPRSGEAPLNPLLSKEVSRPLSRLSALDDRLSSLPLSRLSALDDRLSSRPLSLLSALLDRLSALLLLDALLLLELLKGVELRPSGGGKRLRSSAALRPLVLESAREDLESDRARLDGLSPPRDLLDGRRRYDASSS